MKTRKLSNIQVSFISLVNKGANKKTIIWKDETDPDGEKISRVIQILKSDPEKKMAYGIVYAPNDIDTDSDYAEADEIEKAAYSFMRSGRADYSVDKQHNYEPYYGYVAESWIVKENDSLFPKEIGAWAVGIKVTDDMTWEQIKSGEISGLSMAGTASFERSEKTEKAETSETFIKKLYSFFQKEKQEDDMTKEEVQAIVDETLDTKLTEVKKSFKEEIEKVGVDLTQTIEKSLKAVQEKQSTVVEKQDETVKKTDETDEKLQKSEEKVTELEKAMGKFAEALNTISGAVISKQDSSGTPVEKSKDIFADVVKV